MNIDKIKFGAIGVVIGLLVGFIGSKLFPQTNTSLLWLGTILGLIIGMDYVRYKNEKKSSKDDDENE